MAPGALSVINDRTRFLKYQVLITTRAGVRVSLVALQNREFMQTLSITENVDQPSMECSFEVQLEWENIALSPFRRSNITAEGDPILALDNRVGVFVGIPGNTDSEWLSVFQGRITLVDPSGLTAKVTARDCVHDLTQVWITPNPVVPAEETTEAPEGSRDRLGLIAPTPGGGGPVFYT